MVCGKFLEGSQRSIWQQFRLAEQKREEIAAGKVARLIEDNRVQVGLSRNSIPLPGIENRKVPGLERSRVQMKVLHRCRALAMVPPVARSEEHTSELQSLRHLV